MHYKEPVPADDYDSDSNLPPPGVLVPGKPYTPTEAQRVRIPFGLTPKERKQFIQDDLDAISGAKGASSPVVYG
jgi:hypothetical protein